MCNADAAVLWLGAVNDLVPKRAWGVFGCHLLLLKIELELFKNEERESVCVCV